LLLGGAWKVVALKVKIVAKKKRLEYISSRYISLEPVLY
jgi:hypothetical protein